MKHFISSLFLLLLGFQFNAQAQCSASFTTSNGTLGNNLLHVTLNNTSTYTTPINNYFYTTSIDFGDGNSQTYNGSYGTTHNYSSPGTYLITLTIQVIDTFPNSVMCTDTETGSITIDYAPCSSTATVVDNGNSSYTFTATNPAQTPGIVHTWNFGDGTTATGSTVTHTYTTGANYNVILTSTASGCTSTNNNIYLNVIPNCNQLSAEFAKFQQGLQTNFYNTSTIANYYDFTLHADWYFGDGNSALNINQPVHTYTNPGIYTVMMVNKWMDTVPGQAPSILYCQDTSIQTITVYDNFISGIVSAPFDSFAIVPYGAKVWLITHNATLNTLTAIDSLTTSLNTPYYFHNAPIGDYLVKAAPIYNMSVSNGYVPTYHNNSLFWNTANTLTHSGSYTNGADIDLQVGIVTNGPGFIGGNISAGAGRGTNTGSPNIRIFLRNQQQKLIASTLTDENGNYSLPNLPLGSYEIYPEALNYLTTPYNQIIVTGSNSNHSDMDFIQTDTEFIPSNSTIGIVDKIKALGIKLYPNPAQERIILENNAGAAQSYKIINTLGQVLSTAKIERSTTEIFINHLSNGVYYVIMIGEENNTLGTLKFIKN